MKNILVISVLALTILVLSGAGCTAPRQGGTVTPAEPTSPAVSSGCWFTSCHGLDLACGSSPPQVCTAIYQLGDKCRQYAYCTNASGTCTLVRTPAFDTCRNCIERCGGDTTEILLCEERC